MRRVTAVVLWLGIAFTFSVVWQIEESASSPEGELKRLFSKGETLRLSAEGEIPHPALQRMADAIEFARGQFDKTLGGPSPADAALRFDLYLDRGAFSRSLGWTDVAGGGGTVDGRSSLLYRTGTPCGTFSSDSVSREMMHVLLHEASHQLCRAQSRTVSSLWPDWYREGLAEYFGQRCMIGGVDKEFGLWLRQNDRATVKLAREQGAGLSLADVQTPWGTKTVYGSLVLSHAASLVTTIARDSDKLKRLHAVVSRPNKLLPSRDDIAGLVGHVLAEKGTGVGQLEKEWLRYVEEVELEWVVVSPAGYIDSAGITLVPYTTYSLIVKAEPPSGRRQSLTFEAMSLPDSSGELVVAIGYVSGTPPALCMLALEASGKVSIRELCGGSWKTRSSRTAVLGDLFSGRRTSVEVQCAGGRVRLSVGSRLVLDTALPESALAPKGTIGIGCSNRGSFRIQNIKLRDW